MSPKTEDRSSLPLTWDEHRFGGTSDPTLLTHVILPMWLTLRRPSLTSRVEAIRKRLASEAEESTKRSSPLVEEQD